MHYMGLINEDLQGEMCQKFDILWIIDNANIFFRDFGPLDTKFLDLLLNKKVNYDLRFSDLLSFPSDFRLISCSFSLASPSPFL